MSAYHNLMTAFRENTLHPEFLQVHALTLFPGMVSASRADMFASEIGQAPPLKDSNVRRMLTGMERRFGEYTDKVIMPCDASVIRTVIRRASGGYQGKVPLEKTIIYQDVHNGSYGCVTIPIFSCNHQQFGFDFVRTPIVDNILPGSNIPKGTVLAQSPSIDKYQNYKFGIQGKVAFMSIPEVSQDGAVISQSFAKRASFKGYGQRTFSFGEDIVPLNLFGRSEGEYKIFPDVGELIPDNGLLFATRQVINGLNAVQLSEANLRVWSEADKRTYAKGGAKVVKVEVIHTPTGRSALPEEMTRQCKRYHESDTTYYRDLIDTENKICREVGNRNPLLSPELHELLRTSHARTFVNKGRPTIDFVNNNAPLSEYEVTIHFSYDLEPDTVFKIADLHGGFA